MAGTRAGGLKAAAKLKAKNKNHYQELGAKGKAANPRGSFYYDKELASEAGRKGGQVSRKNK